MNYNNTCDKQRETLDVRFTKFCDNSCAFCIEKNGIDSLVKKPDVDKLVAETIKLGIKNVLIVGGEPMLFPKEVLDYTTRVRSCVDEMYITTSLPKNYYTNTETWNKIIETCTMMNVSIQSIYWKENNKILNASSNHDRIQQLSSLLYNHADKIRVNINLTKGGIDTNEKLNDTLQALQSMGCKHVKINELQERPDIYVSYEEITGTKLKSAYAYGCSTFIETEFDMKVLLRRSCFITEPSIPATIADLIKCTRLKYFPLKHKPTKVLYEDGTLSNIYLQK